MQTLTYHTVDKSSWPAGPWQSEPDKKQWPDAATGLPCLIVRNHSGALCGYVGVAPDHPLHGQSYDEADCDVHGGLTFSSACRPSAKGEAHGICHTPGEGEPEHVWWFGFDCAHLGDYSPQREVSYGAEIYRDLPYVERQCAKLAAQLAEWPPR